jgi:hypothetical protein
VLLADGNIGIGGDPIGLLRRCAGLLDSAGAVLAELQAPGEASWSGDIVLRDRWRRSAPFPWASVSADHVDELADLSGLQVSRVWTEAGRWFAELRPR